MKVLGGIGLELILIIILIPIKGTSVDSSEPTSLLRSRTLLSTMTINNFLLIVSHTPIVICRRI